MTPEQDLVTVVEKVTLEDQLEDFKYDDTKNMLGNGVILMKSTIYDSELGVEVELSDDDRRILREFFGADL